jgi:hypothetical protein
MTKEENEYGMETRGQRADAAEDPGSDRLRMIDTAR